MWDTLDNARTALERDGWTRDTPYWFHKTVSGRRVWVEIDWWDEPDRRYVPIYHGPDDE